MAVGFSWPIIFFIVLCCCTGVQPQVDQPLIINVSSSVCHNIVAKSGGNCTDLDTVLDWLSSDVIITLDEGTHLINRSHHVDIRGALNIKIIGAGANVTAITCADQNGLAFVGITNLTLVNFTITGCGLSGGNMLYHVTLLSEVLDLWFMIPPATKIALFLGHCTNVMIQGLNITETAGLGFLGINILGKSSIKRSGFTNNIRPVCLSGSPQIIPSLINPEIYDQVGGGAFFLYADIFNSSIIDYEVKLLLSELYFAYNADCTFAANTILNFPYFIDGRTNLPLYNYTIGAGGGLSVILSNKDFEVSVDVYDSIFYKNEARHGSGAFVASFAGFQNPLAVTFKGCMFTENGLTASYDSNGARACCNGGAGIAIFTDLLKPNYSLSAIATARVQFLFEIFATEFINNLAQVQGGGIFAYSLLKTQQQFSSVNEGKRFYSIVWSLINISLTNNSALYGSAGFFYQMADFSFDGLVLLKLVNITATENHNQVMRSNHIGDGSTLHMKNIVGDFKDVTLENNIGSALRLDSTVVYIQPSSRLIFRGNTAHRGGALYLSGHSPALIVDKNCSLHFEENTAHMEGGAIYYSPPDLSGDILQSYNLRGCFLLTPSFSPTRFYEDFRIFDFGIKVLFRNNQAKIGSTIFGSSLESCSWAKKMLLSRENISLYSKLYREYNSTFSFDRNPSDELFVSTLPTSISVKTGTEEPLQTYPGQAIPIEIKVLDFYNNTIPSIVTAAVNTKYKVDMRTFFRESGFWYTDIANTTLSVASALNGLVSVSIITSTSSVSTTVSLNLSSCPIGFELNQDTLKCSCSNLFLNQTRVTCDRNDITFEVIGDYWIGVDPTIVEPTSEDLILSTCIFNYCVNGRFDRNFRKTVTPAKIESQCNFNRTGILCGSCNMEEGYSNVLGSYECHKCNNYSFSLIIAFAFAGAVMFSGIFFLELTINKGWTNSVIFFCNIVFIYDYLALDARFSYAFLPVNLINLQIGVSLCFYDGMTSLSRTSVQLLLPMYLCILMVVFTILCRRFSWMSTHFSPAKSLLTLSVLCYTSVLTTCVELMGMVRIETFGGRNFSYRWYNDPNQVYFQGSHAFLCAISIAIILIYIIPFPILLLFPNLAYKHLVRFTPLFDALWAAYKPKYRFWFGLRLMSVVLLLASTRLPGTYGIFFSGVYAVIFFLLQGTLQPFKEKVANHADTFFLTIVLLFYWANICRISFNFNFDLTAKIIAGLFVYLLTALSYLIMLLLFILHLHHKFPCLWKKLRLCLVIPYEHLHCKDKKKSPTTQMMNSMEDGSTSSKSENSLSHNTSVRIHECQQHPGLPKFSLHLSNLHLRESLLV